MDYMKQWKLGLMILGGLVLVGFLTYAVMQATQEIEHIIAVGISNMYSQEQ